MLPRPLHNTTFLQYYYYYYSVSEKKRQTVSAKAASEEPQTVELFPKRAKIPKTYLTRSKVLKYLLKDFYNKLENEELDIIDESEDENFEKLNNINKSKLQNTEKLDIIFFNLYLNQEYGFPVREKELDSDESDIEIELEKFSKILFIFVS
jgi:hypothetical protein